MASPKSTKTNIPKKGVISRVNSDARAPRVPRAVASAAGVRRGGGALPRGVLEPPGRLSGDGRGGFALGTEPWGAAGAVRLRPAPALGLSCPPGRRPPPLPRAVAGDGGPRGPPRATRARGEPELPAQERLPPLRAPAGWGGCSRERRGGAGRRGFGGRGEACGRGRGREGSRGGGQGRGRGEAAPASRREPAPDVRSFPQSQQQAPRRRRREANGGGGPGGRKEGAGRRRPGPPRPGEARPPTGGRRPLTRARRAPGPGASARRRLAGVTRPPPERCFLVMN